MEHEVDEGSLYEPAISDCNESSGSEAVDEDANEVSDAGSVAVTEAKFKGSIHAPQVQRRCLNNMESESNTECEEAQHVTVKEIIKNKTGGVVRTKGHCCMFCNKIMVNLSRHFENMHDEEVEVARLLVMPKKSRIRRKGFTELARIGDYYHNCEVLSKCSGELLVLQRPSQIKDFQYKDYGPCPFCLGFMIRKHLWQHRKYSCSVKGPKENTDKHHRGILDDSKLLLASSLNTELHNAFVEKVLSRMREDDIGKTAKEDAIILKYGVLQFDKYGNKKTELIRQNMRELGQLLLTLQNENLSNVTTGGDKQKLQAWLHPSNFDTIIKAVKDICAQDHFNKLTLMSSFKLPTLAVKLGQSIRKCIVIERGVSLRNCDRERNEQMKDMLNLLETGWASKISSNTLTYSSTRHINKIKLLPVTSDLVKLNDYMSTEIKFLKESTAFDWTRLAELTLSKIVLFNKRMSEEASRLEMSQYLSRTSWTNKGPQETNMCLTELEKKLLSRMVLLEIIEKMGTAVPIILTPDVKENVDILISKRKDAGVSDNNPFVFATVGGSLGHLRSHDCLEKLSCEAGLKSPHLITSTHLKKYIATVIQIFNLTENEMDWLSRQLGQDIRVHRQFYKSQEAIVETTKVSCLLLAVEQGNAHLFQGKMLEDINVDLLDYSDDSSSRSSEEESIEDKRREGMKFQKRKDVSESISIEDKMESSGSRPLVHIEGSKRKKVRKRPWTLTEANAVLSYFRNNTRRGEIPRKEQCERCKEGAKEVLTNRSWRDIKYYIYNRYKKMKNTS